MSFTRDIDPHAPDRAALTESHRRAREQREAREAAERPFDPLAIRDLGPGRGVEVGGIKVEGGHGAQNLSDEQMEALARWCEKNGKMTTLSNARRHREARRAQAERETREHEEKIARNQRQALAAAALREVEHFEAIRDKAELEVGRLVAEHAAEGEIRCAEGKLAIAERQVMRATAKARWLKQQATF